MSFFDEADEPAPPPRRSRRTPTGGGGPTDQQTLLVRRALALGAGLLFFILLVVVVNGCLDSRKERSLKDYNRNVGALMQQDDEQVGKALFQQLSNPPTSALDLQTGLNQLRVASNDILSRAKKLDVPGDMEHAQFYLLTTLELRRDAIGAIAGKITAALGSRNSDEAIKQIAGQMQAFLASDVIYSQRVIPNINKALDDNGIGGQHIQTSTFFDDFSWLAPQTVATKLGQSLSESAGGSPRPARTASASSRPPSAARSSTRPAATRSPRPPTSRSRSRPRTRARTTRPTSRCASRSAARASRSPRSAPLPRCSAAPP